ncbi:hypothetical protein C6P45_001177 [Maudiozyma exigua]|uniref:Major facilitator superfamily (MFS) profile domain-containing protein n=1 Tax=Maudiozyma exigua TaxID=34358 RepID=A0A9P6WDE0_MAUEX|nr:hypothetical protein C6P45_001177 [Kazachstania exigua]
MFTVFKRKKELSNNSSASLENDVEVDTTLCDDKAVVDQMKQNDYEYEIKDDSETDSHKKEEQDSEDSQTSEVSSADNPAVKNSKWQNPDYFDSAFKEYIFVMSCMLANLLNQAGQTQVLSTMNVISDAFNSDDKKKPWLMASFPLVSGSFILVSGRLGDIYGLRKTLIWGCIVMTIWSLICGFADYSGSDAFFIVCRSFQGLGISLVLPNIMGLVGNIYQVGSMRKNIVISLIGCMAPVGATFGGLWGGLIVYEDPKQWPWIFYAYGIASFVNLLMILYTVPKNIPTNVNNFKMDWIGSVIGVLGLIIFNFVWNQGPIDGWQKAYVIVLLIISTLLLVAFFVYEIKWAEHPLLPPAVTKNRHIITILISLFFGWGSFGIWTFYYYSFNLNLRHFSPLWAGSTHFIFIIFGTLAAFFVAFFMKKIGPSIVFCLSSIGFTCGCIIFSVTPPSQTYWRNSLGMQVILAMGMDFSFPGSSIILSDELPMEYQGMAGSLVNTIVNYATSLFLGMGTTVEMQINKDGTNTLGGYRSALYLGIGLGGIGFLFSFSYMIEDLWKNHRLRMKARASLNNDLS